jgi:hypothetical protein
MFSGPEIPIMTCAWAAKASSPSTAMALKSLVLFINKFFVRDGAVDDLRLMPTSVI